MAKLIAYVINKEETYSNTRIIYDSKCGDFLSPLWKGTETYNEVPFFSGISTFDNGKYFLDFTFKLSEQGYSLDAAYSPEALTDAEITALNAHIQETLEKYLREIIDQYKER